MACGCLADAPYHRLALRLCVTVFTRCILVARAIHFVLCVVVGNETGDGALTGESRYLVNVRHGKSKTVGIGVSMVTARWGLNVQKQSWSLQNYKSVSVFCNDLMKISRSLQYLYTLS